MAIAIIATRQTIAIHSNATINVRTWNGNVPCPHPHAVYMRIDWHQIALKSHWIELNWLNMMCSGDNWIELHEIDCGWVVMPIHIYIYIYIFRIEHNWIESNWTELNGMELNWSSYIESLATPHWFALNWIPLDWI